MFDDRLATIFLGLVLTVSYCDVSVAASTCGELARTIAYNRSRNFASAEMSSLNKIDFCSERYSASKDVNSAKIEAAYQAAYSVSGSASLDSTKIRTEQDKVCESKYGSDMVRSISESSSVAVSSEGAEIIKKCLELERTGITDISLSAAGKEFSFSFVWRPSQQVKLRLAGVGPTSFEGYTCRVSARRKEGISQVPVKSIEDTVMDLDPLDSFSMLCGRPVASVATEDGTATKCSEETIFQVAAANAAVVSITIPKSCDPVYPGELFKKAEVELARLREDNKKLLQDAATERTQSAGVISSLQSQLNTANASLQASPTWIPSGLYLDPSSGKPVGNNCQNVCANNGRAPVISGQYIGAPQGSFHICRANTAQQGNRPGFQMVPLTDKGCNVAWSSSSVVEQTFDCLCK